MSPSLSLQLTLSHGDGGPPIQTTRSHAATTAPVVPGPLAELPSIAGSSTTQPRGRGWRGTSAVHNYSYILSIFTESQYRQVKTEEEGRNSCCSLCSFELTRWIVPILYDPAVAIVSAQQASSLHTPSWFREDFIADRLPTAARLPTAVLAAASPTTTAVFAAHFSAVPRAAHCLTVLAPAAVPRAAHHSIVLTAATVHAAVAAAAPCQSTYWAERNGPTVIWIIHS